jgi:hypothetical protein
VCWEIRGPAYSREIEPLSPDDLGTGLLRDLIVSVGQEEEIKTYTTHGFVED